MGPGLAVVTENELRLILISTLHVRLESFWRRQQQVVLGQVTDCEARESWKTTRDSTPVRTPERW